MPIYEYECLACKTRFERSQRFSDPPVTECPECGGNVRRVLFPAGIVFKGSGWYITDSRSSTSTAAGSTPNGAASENKTDSGGKEGAATSESASPAKTDTASSSSTSSTKSS